MLPDPLASSGVRKHQKDKTLTRVDGDTQASTGRIYRIQQRGDLMSKETDADIDAFMSEMRAVGAEYVGICDGCAQSRDECLCDLDLAEVLDCASVYHPGCSKCGAK